MNVNQLLVSMETALTTSTTITVSAPRDILESTVKLILMSVSAVLVSMAAVSMAAMALLMMMWLMHITVFVH